MNKEAQFTMKDKNSDEPSVFYIPHNYIDSGSVLGGTFKLRNAIESLIIVVTIGYILSKISIMSIMNKLIFFIIVAFPLGILALVGVNGGSFFEFIHDVFNYLFSQKDVMFYLEYKQEVALQKKNEKKNEKEG